MGCSSLPLLDTADDQRKWKGCQRQGLSAHERPARAWCTQVALICACLHDSHEDSVKPRAAVATLSHLKHMVPGNKDTSHLGTSQASKANLLPGVSSYVRGEMGTPAGACPSAPCS